MPRPLVVAAGFVLVLAVAAPAQALFDGTLTANKCVAERSSASRRPSPASCNATRGVTARDSRRSDVSPSAATVSSDHSVSDHGCFAKRRSSAAAARASATPAPSPRGSRRTSARSCTGSSRAARRRIPARPRRSCAYASTTPACCARFGRPRRPAPPSAASTSAATTSTEAAAAASASSKPATAIPTTSSNAPRPSPRASLSRTRARSASRTTPSSTT